MENKADLVPDVAAATPDLTDLPAYSAKDSASIETLEYTFSLPDHKGNESLKLKFATRATGQNSLNARGERLTDRILVVYGVVHPPPDVCWIECLKTASIVSQDHPKVSLHIVNIWPV